MRLYQRPALYIAFALCCVSTGNAIEPISTSIAVGMAAALTGLLAIYPNMLCSIHECCQEEWIAMNSTVTRSPYSYNWGNKLDCQ